MNCPDCKGTGKYVGLTITEPCAKCFGIGAVGENAVIDVKFKQEQKREKYATLYGAVVYEKPDLGDALRSLKRMSNGTPFEKYQAQKRNNFADIYKPKIQFGDMTFEGEDFDIIRKDGIVTLIFKRPITVQQGEELNIEYTFSI